MRRAYERGRKTAGKARKSQEKLGKASKKPTRGSGLKVARTREVPKKSRKMLSEALGMWTVRGWRAKNDAERGRRSRFAGNCRRGAREHSRGTAAPGAVGTSQAGRGDVGGSGVGGGGSASRFAGTVGAAESPSLSFAVAASGSFGLWGCGQFGVGGWRERVEVRGDCRRAGVAGQLYSGDAVMREVAELAVVDSVNWTAVLWRFRKFASLAMRSSVRNLVIWAVRRMRSVREFFLDLAALSLLVLDRGTCLFKDLY